MNTEQLERWQDFAIRAARSVFSPSTEARSQKRLAEVEGFFENFIRENEDNLPALTEWIQDPIYLCDYVIEYWDEYYVPDWRPGYGNCFCSQLITCVRGGFCAVTEEIGTAVFTPGDIRRMYNNVIPAWLNDQYDTPISLMPENAVVVI
ncbi:MAG: hypothetical protein AAGF24_05335 [Cyanobacteria bacterium P01_H01_bin.121]